MIKIESASEKASVEKSFSWKPYFLIGITCISGFLASFFLESGRYVGGAVFIVLFLAFFVIEVLFISVKSNLAWAAVLNALVTAIPLFGLLSLYFVIGFLIFLAFLVYGALRGLKEIDNMLKINFARLVRVISTATIGGTVIFFSASVIAGSDFSINKSGIDKAIEVSTPIIEKFFDGFNGKDTAGVFLNKFVENQLKSNQQFVALSQAERREIVEAQSLELETKIEEIIGASIDKDSTVSENIYEIVDERLSTLNTREQMLLSAVLISIVWISVRGIDFLIYIPLSILVFLLYEFLFSIKFAAVQLETRSKEIISLK